MAERPYVLTPHFNIVESATRQYAFDPAGDIAAQKTRMTEKLFDLLGVPEKRTSPEPRIEYVCEDDPRFDEIRFRFESEPNYFIPAHMLLPKGVWKAGGAKLPTVICLQGHSTGMHISLGRAKYEGDEKTISGGDRDFCIQAVALGYAAVCMEQRGFGELDGKIPGLGGRCYSPSVQAMMLGRTLIGERASDVSRLIDALSCFDECDMDRLGLMGNSGGGTATYYTACVEPRVKIAMPSCAFCSYNYSIFPLRHCICNFVPGSFKYFDMGDLALMIAPRPLIVVCGRLDHGFLFEGVKQEYATVEKIYESVGASDACELVVGEEGHRFYAAQSWPVYAKMLAKL
ncbi:MAG: hypothetical protein E7463_10495 [Ruminococcaceae bacterium]|nr:hypothetical protein [Oscillospiraceae bacterium]